MNSDQAHQRAERNFKKEERVRDGRQAMIEYEVQVRATRAKTERLLREAIGLHVAGLREDGLAVPKPTSVVRYLEFVA